MNAQLATAAVKALLPQSSEHGFTYAVRTDAYAPGINVEIYFDIRTDSGHEHTDYVEVVTDYEWRGSVRNKVFVSGVHLSVHSNLAVSSVSTLCAALNLAQDLLPGVAKITEQWHIELEAEREARDAAIEAKRLAIAAAEPTAEQRGASPTRWDKAPGRRVWHPRYGLGTVLEYFVRTYSVKIVFDDPERDDITERRDIAKSNYTWFK